MDTEFTPHKNTLNVYLYLEQVFLRDKFEPISVCTMSMQRDRTEKVREPPDLSRS